MNLALFLDRDGIFNELAPWENGIWGAPRNRAELKFRPEIEGIEKAKALGFRLILVTNQPDVARGIIDKQFVEEINQHYAKKYQLDAVYVCFSADDADPMRKPNPGMFLKAAEDFDLDLSRCFHLGDTIKDVEAAKRCGVKSILWDHPYNQRLSADFRIRSLTELFEVLSISYHLS